MNATTRARPRRWFTVIVATVAVMSVATVGLANPPEGTPGGPPSDVVEQAGQQGAPFSQQGQAIAAERQAFALGAQELAAAFALAVTEWTTCVSEAASSNENTEDEERDEDYVAVNPLSVCGELPVTQSPGHAISALSIS